jgi:elongation factor Ts
MFVRDDLDPEILEREKAIYMVQAEESGKPKEIMEKMIEGKLKRFLSEVSLAVSRFCKRFRSYNSRTA